MKLRYNTWELLVRKLYELSFDEIPKDRKPRVTATSLTRSGPGLRHVGNVHPNYVAIIGVLE